MAYYVVDTFSPIPFHGSAAPVVLIDKSTPVDDELKQKLASEFNHSATAFLTPIDTDDFQTAKKLDLRWFTPDSELSLCGNGTLAAAHVLKNNVRNPNEEFEFQTRFGQLKAHVGKHNLVKIILPAVKVYSLNTHKQALTDKLEQIEDTNGIGLKIAGLLPSDITINQLAYSPDLKYLLIALDQSTTHEQFTSLKLCPAHLMAADPNGDFVRAVIITFHFIPNEQSSFNNFLALTTQPDYVLRVFEPWVGVDEDQATGSAQCVAAKFWGTVYNRFENLRAHQHHPKRSSEFRIDSVNDKEVEISGQALTIFSGTIEVDKILK